MADVKETLAAIFADIPIDGSNIKDDDDDDNGYKISEGIQTVTFEEKVSELSDKMRSAPTVKVLPLSESGKTEPAVKESAVAKLPATPQVAPEPPKNVEAVKSTVPEVKVAVPEERATIPELITEFLQPKTSKSVPITESTVVQSHTQIEETKGTAEQLMKLDKVVDDSGISKDSNEIKGDKLDVSKPVEDNVEIRPVEPPEWEVINETIVWKLRSAATKPVVVDLYKTKRQTLRYILPGGQLPIKEYLEELRGASVNSDVSSNNPADIYDRMQEVQGWRNRVVEIRFNCEEQYFLWKRHIEMFRGMAGQAELAKGAAVDAAALKHLPDFELYWCKLESVVKATDGILKNLEAAYETLSRQVSILLEARKASSDGSRFEHREVEQKNVETKVIKNAELQNFDSLDEDMNHPPTKPSLGDWEIIK